MSAFKDMVERDLDITILNTDEFAELHMVCLLYTSDAADD